MKTISFSVVKILPALLSEKKKQTIRPAWKIKVKLYTNYAHDLVSEPIIKQKQPRFKVGESVKLYWKQRCKDRKFCVHCGIAVKEYGSTCPCCKDKEGNIIKPKLMFDKVLGESKITEVFEIEIGKNSSGYYLSYVEQPYTIGIALMYHIGSGTAEMMAERDGFESAEEMFKHFDEEYDLSSSKRFYVYRWK